MMTIPKILWIIQPEELYHQPNIIHYLYPLLCPIVCHSSWLKLSLNESLNPPFVPTKKYVSPYDFSICFYYVWRVFGESRYGY